MTPAAGEHPWRGRTFTAGWGSRDVLDVTLVHPQLVVEVEVDGARDAANCAHCSEKVHVTQGDKIPSCPNGHMQFETRRNEPGNKS